MRVGVITCCCLVGLGCSSTPGLSAGVDRSTDASTPDVTVKVDVPVAVDRPTILDVSPDVGVADTPSPADVPVADLGDVQAAIDAPLDAGARVDVVPPVDTGSPLTTTIYAHSEALLYTLDPRTNAFATVGMFTFPADGNNHSMNDLAVDADGRVVGNTQNALYRIDPATAACALITTLPGGNFVGLTYVPVGVIAGTTGEVLVGGTRTGTYWRIDPSTGTSTQLGQLALVSGGTTINYGLSGDFVSVVVAGTYATVRSSKAATSDHDELASVNLANGQITVLGNTGFDGIFGLAYYRDTLYGFTRNGAFLTINARTGAGMQVSALAPQFYGAGVTTIAPVAPP